jgi:hypothetical protein
VICGNNKLCPSKVYHYHKSAEKGAVVGFAVVATCEFMKSMRWTAGLTGSDADNPAHTWLRKIPYYNVLYIGSTEVAAVGQNPWSRSSDEYYVHNTKDLGGVFKRDVFYGRWM